MYQIIKKANPDSNGNFESLVLIYDATGNITEGNLQGDSKPNTLHLKNEVELPGFTISNSDFNFLKVRLKLLRVLTES